MREKKSNNFLHFGQNLSTLKTSFINNSKNSAGIVCQLNEVINVFIIWHHLLIFDFAGIIIAHK